MNADTKAALLDKYARDVEKGRMTPEELARVRADLDALDGTTHYAPGESVICPACRVPVGSPCLTRDARLASRPHVVRLHAEEQREHLPPI